MNGDISYVCVAVQMACDQEIRLPDWLASTIRGAIGMRMIHRNCLREEVDCTKCSRKDSCVTGIMFGKRSERESDLCAMPFVVCNCHQEGCVIEFELRLFGRGIEILNDILCVLRNGLVLGSHKTLFHLEDLHDLIGNRSLIYDGEILFPEVGKLVFSECEMKSLRVEFVSPLVCKRKGDEIDFDYFLRACVRRVTGMWTANDMTFSTDFDELFARAKTVKTVNRKLKAVPMERHSSRTGTSLSKVGLVGTFEFCGELTEASKWLLMAEKMGIGKMCVMGLGQFCISR